MRDGKKVFKLVNCTWLLEKDEDITVRADKHAYIYTVGGFLDHYAKWNEIWN